MVVMNLLLMKRGSEGDEYGQEREKREENKIKDSFEKIIR